VPIVPENGSLDVCIVKPVMGEKRIAEDDIWTVILWLSIGDTMSLPAKVNSGSDCA
jgi:hypothetical protein